MKPNDIFKVLDLAFKVRQTRGKPYNPLFTGEAGLGKSQICQAWAKEMRKKLGTFGFVDLRLAYMEGPDFIGLPRITESEAKRLVTEHIIPKIWDKICETPNGLLLIEEPNRANSSVLNCLMQVLTDHEVNGVKLPQGWVIAGAINPDVAGYDVNTMDTALRDRFVPYEIEYDHKTFVDYMERNNFEESILNFVKSGLWQYKKACEIGNDGKYVSPRTFATLNEAEQVGLKHDSNLHLETSASTLGKHVGRDYWKFKFEVQPVMVMDLLEDEKKALKLLKKYSDPNNYRGDLINLTVSSITENYLSEITFDKKKVKIDNDFVLKVVDIIPLDQAISMLKTCVVMGAQKGHEVKLGDFLKLRPDLMAKMKEDMRSTKGTL